MNTGPMNNNCEPDESNSECQDNQICPAATFMYAHAYVPYQYLTCVYPPMEGLQQGTIFPELDRPYGADPEYTVDA